jgi:transposase
VNCGHTDNADLNAAKNICDKDIEKKIKDSHCYKAGEKIDKSLSMII